MTRILLDMDLSKDNLPAGTRLQLGTAVIEVTAEPRTGCSKFVDRFGLEAMKFVNSRRGKKLCLQGINAKVVQPGAFSVGGDRARRLSPDPSARRLRSGALRRLFIWTWLLSGADARSHGVFRYRRSR